MPRNPLFSTYRQGENRVTSSMLAVFERVDLSLLETILAAAAGESSLQMVSFTNQPPGRGHSVPDARISAQFAYWFEVKTARNALDAVQLNEHCANLGTEGGDEMLFAISPDLEQPSAVTEVSDSRIVWFNFRALHDAIDAALGDPEAASEKARFLLRELQALLVDEGVLDSNDVVIVAARFAYPEYLKYGVYVCQAGRAFRYGLTNLGFYTDKAIQTCVPRIRHREDHVTFTKEEAARRRAGSVADRQIAEVIETSLAEGTREESQQYQVFLLSGLKDEDTVQLEQPILNDTLAESGRAWAWTLGQRYVSLAGLTAPGVTATSQLQTP